MLKLSTHFTNELNDYLQKKAIISADETPIVYEKAGEGNMNFVARLTTSSQSIILKQSRAYVEKYPQIPAPIERIEIEKIYYQSISSNEKIQAVSPKVLAFDAKNYLLILNDLGKGSDFLASYKQPEIITPEITDTLVDYLIELHQISVENFPSNLKMKQLNHVHIFNFPFDENNGFDLDTIQQGLQEVSLEYKRNEQLKRSINTLGENYLANGNTLLHGDFYPGSWLSTENGIAVIDPEFAFMGNAEFDLGVMIAHFKLAKISSDLIDRLKANYKAELPINDLLLDAYVGVEILRRLLGIAQLPVGLSLAEKERLLSEAAALLLNERK